MCDFSISESFRRIEAKVRSGDFYSEQIEKAIQEEVANRRILEGDAAAAKYEKGLRQRAVQGMVSDTEFLGESAQREAFALEMEKSHPVGFLKTPKDIDDLPPLCIPPTGFVSPNKVDLQCYCLPPTDQGHAPSCAAHACSGWAANILWRKTGVPKRIDPDWIYAEAKKIDGAPTEPGTTLPAVLQVLLNARIFDPSICRIRVIRSIEQLKYGIHKFGCLLLGTMVSREWYACNRNKPSIYGQGDSTIVGGHATLACGYTPEGLIGQNSWGEPWGRDGFFIISWKELAREFAYASVLDNSLNDMRM